MSTSSNIIHKITEKEIQKCWEFGLKYYLDSTKSIQNRTVGQNRGLGGILDSFLNKIIEIAVCGELEKLNKKIKCIPDFEIHKLKKGKTEPDIFKISRNGKKELKNPKLYVEIKNISNKDNWLGPKAEELESISNNEYGITDTKKMFYVYGEIIDSKKDSNDRLSSLLGSYLKKLIPGDTTLEKFHSITDLSVEIKYVFSIHDIETYGTSFPAHGYMTNPNIFSIPAKTTQNKILKKMNDVATTKVDTSGKKFPRKTGTFLPKKENQIKKIRLPYLAQFGDISFTGDIEMYKEEHNSTINHFFHCIKKVTVSHKVLGNWNFDKGDVRNYKIVYSGRDPELRKDNKFVARRNTRITSKFGADRLQEIADGI